MEERIIDPLLAPAWATFNAFRKMGFPSRIIYFGAWDGYIFVTLLDAGKRFDVKIRSIPEGMTIDEVTARWRQMVDDMKSKKITEESMAAAWDEWDRKTNKVAFIFAMCSVGFDAADYREEAMRS